MPSFSLPRYIPLSSLTAGGTIVCTSLYKSGLAFYTPLPLVNSFLLRFGVSCPRDFTAITFDDFLRINSGARVYGKWNNREARCSGVSKQLLLLEIDRFSQRNFRERGNDY